MRAITWTKDETGRYINRESNVVIGKTADGKWLIIRPLLVADGGIMTLDAPQRTLRDAKAIAQAWILTHHRPMVEAAEALAYETAPLVVWTRRTGENGGAEFTSAGGRVVVRRITWKRPGFKNIDSTGWTIFVNGSQVTAAHRSATEAMRWAELPGVAADIDRWLASA